MSLFDQIISIDPEFFYEDPAGKRYSICGVGVGKGWNKLVLDALKKIKEACKENGVDLPKIDQIKEKFGGLRIYMSCHYDFVEEIIHQAERKADETCEVTGKAGKLCVNQHGCYKTVSNEYAKENGFKEC